MTPAAPPQQYDAPTRPVGSTSGPSPVHQWPAPQNDHVSYLSQSQPGGMMPGHPNAHPAPNGHPGMHDPAMLQAAQLLLPGDYPTTGKVYATSHAFMDATADHLPALPYLPEDLNHFQEFTHFLDSIGLPAEWLPAEGEAAQIQDIGLEDVQRPTQPPQEQPRPRGNTREESRGDSPFRSWLPSVPRGDQSLTTISDTGMLGVSIFALSVKTDNTQSRRMLPSPRDSMSPRTNDFDWLLLSKTFAMSSPILPFHLATL